MIQLSHPYMAPGKNIFLTIHTFVRYADDTTLMAESKEIKSLLMKVKKESENLA